MFYHAEAGRRPGSLLRNVWLVLVAVLAVCTLFVGSAAVVSAAPRTADPSTVSVTGALADGTGAVAGV